MLFASLFLFACAKEPEPKPTSPLFVQTSTNGEIRFNVELAQTPEELQTGLMHRTQLPNNNGMIFSFEPVRPVQMWMKNTKLSLDMLFVAPNGKIIMIKEKAVPLSEDRITCKEPVRAVVELNAGQVSRHKIQVGDTVKHKIFDKLTALTDAPVMPKGPNAVMPKGPNAGPIVPKGPNAVMPKGPNAVIPKGPNAVIPKGPNAVMPKGPNAVIPKGPNAVIPKGPNANPNGPVIPKGPNAPSNVPVPVVPPM